MKKYHLFAEINVDGNKACHNFTSDNFYEMLGKIVVLYRNGYSVELYINEEDISIAIYKHEQGKKEEGILRLED
jgi:adenylate cyclase